MVGQRFFPFGALSDYLQGHLLLVLPLMKICTFPKDDRISGRNSGKKCFQRKSVECQTPPASHPSCSFPTKSLTTNTSTCCPWRKSKSGCVFLVEGLKVGAKDQTFDVGFLVKSCKNQPVPTRCVGSVNFQATTFETVKFQDV